MEDTIMFSCSITFGTLVTAHISGFILAGLKLIFFFLGLVGFFLAQLVEDPVYVLWPVASHDEVTPIVEDVDLEVGATKTSKVEVPGQTCCPSGQPAWFFGQGTVC